MKKIKLSFIVLIVLFVVNGSWAQGVAINETSTPPDGSAILDVSSDSLGILIPRMTRFQRNSILSPVAGLMIYQTNYTPGFYFYDGTTWSKVGGAGNPLEDGKILIGNASNKASEAVISGDATISNAGVLTIGDQAVDQWNIAPGSITSAHIQSSVINSSHIANGTVHTADIQDGTVSSADIQDGTVSSADIQNGTINGVDINLNAGINATSISPGDVDNTEFGYLDGVTGNIQDQIDNESTSRQNADNTLQTELNTTQSGAGLNANGTYTPAGSANYIGTATSLKNADNKLDTQVKTNADDISTNASAIGANTTDISTNASAIGANNALFGTAGTVEASKAVVVDANRDIGNFNDLQADGTITSGGSIVIDGTGATYGTITESHNRISFGNDTLVTTGVIGVGTTSPSGSAALEINSTGLGFLASRMGRGQRNAIPSPATGLLIYQTNFTPGFYYYNGTEWKLVGAEAFGIDELRDGKTISSSVFLGENAGINEYGLDYRNVALGVDALKEDTTGERNTAVGFRALWLNSNGSHNTANGYGALVNNTIGNRNTAIGYQSLLLNTIGIQNTAIGHNANFNNEEGSYNTIFGYQAGMGSEPHNKSGNVFLGYQAGYNETSDNKLYIENSNSSFPLIYGDFENDTVRINGDFQVTGDWVDIAINDLADGRTDGGSVYLGTGAGANDDGTDNQNVAVGIDALKENTTGGGNTAIGYLALYSNTSAANTAIGKNALGMNTTGHDNVGIGLAANYNNVEGSFNTIIGDHAGRGLILHNKTGNVIIGYEAGFSTTTGSDSNVFIGNKAGYHETGDHKLYIENTDSYTPLIYGEFDNDFITVYGNLGVGKTSFGGGNRTIALPSSTAPTSSISDGVLLYAAGTNSELLVRDELGNITVLSPHNFSMLNKSEPMAWSYYSENHAIGKKINVDMLRMVRLVEEFTGEKLAYVEDIDNDTDNFKVENETKGIIQKQQNEIERQQKEIDNLKKLNLEMLQRIEKLEGN